VRAMPTAVDLKDGGDGTVAARYKSMGAGGVDAVGAVALIEELRRRGRCVSLLLLLLLLPLGPSNGGLDCASPVP